MLLIGFALGVLATLLAIAFFITAVSYSRPTAKMPEQQTKNFKTKIDLWPPHIRAKLQNVDDKDWVNAMVHRFWIQLMSSDVFRIRITKRLQERLDQKLLSNLVESVVVQEIFVGQAVPVVQEAITCQVQEDCDLLLNLKVDYSGGCRIVIVTTLSTLNVKIPVSVTLKAFQGLLQVRVPSPSNEDQYAISFVKDPGFDFLVESSLWRRDTEVKLKEVLNSFIGRRIKSICNEAFVLPNWRSFDLPLVNYRPVIVEELEQQSVQESRRSSGEEKTSWIGVRYPKQKIADVLTGKCYPVDYEVDQIDLPQYKQLLTSLMASIGQEKLDNSGDSWLYSFWEVIRNRRDILVQKKTVVVKNDNDPVRADVYRGAFTVDCSVEQAFKILSNIEHQGIIEDSFVNAVVIKKFSDDTQIMRLNYKISNKSQVLHVVQFKQAPYVIAHRSIRVLDTSLQENLSLPREEPIVYMFGYILERVDPGKCRIICVSQFGTSSLQRLDITWARCLKLRNFVEELLNWNQSMISPVEEQRQSFHVSKSQAPLQRRRLSDGHLTERWKKMSTSFNIRKNK